MEIIGEYYSMLGIVQLTFLPLSSSTILGVKIFTSGCQYNLLNLGME